MFPPLVARLAEGARRRFTLVAAPTGSGKTMLVAECAADVGQTVNGPGTAGEAHEIRVRGWLGDEWSEWFGGLGVSHEAATPSCRRWTEADQRESRRTVRVPLQKGLRRVVSREERLDSELVQRNEPLDRPAELDEGGLDVRVVSRCVI